MFQVKSAASVDTLPVRFANKIDKVATVTPVDQHTGSFDGKLGGGVLPGKNTSTWGIINYLTKYLPRMTDVILYSLRNLTKDDVK